jgi:superfamily II DNA or RNA helicase/transcriptional regulator with XRE-family HTH domain
MVSIGKIGSPDWVKSLRNHLGLTQTELADRLGVTYVTISRWENGQARPNRLAIRAMTSLAESSNPTSQGSQVREGAAPYNATSRPVLTDFQADPELVRLFVEGERLRYGHLFSPVFGTETALIDPLPHQIIAVYQHMLSQPRLRFLLADDAGAGKTIMAGLYLREMLNRRLIRRVLIVPPAGLVGNWKREMRALFSMRFREVTGADCRDDNPFAGPGSDLVIVSVDTLSGGRAFQRLADPETEPYDLVIFDEAHKLSANRNADGSYETTDRYKLAELVAGAEPLQESRPPLRLPWHAHHLLLLTATPHMGKDFPYYALWRLLEPGLLHTADAFNAFPIEARAKHFLRRTKEEMVRFDGTLIYPTRVSQTASYDLTPLEWELYEGVTDYVQFHYNRARFLNRSAALLAMSILQRRAASSTWAMLRSLERRRDRLDNYIGKVMARVLTEEQFQVEQRGLSFLDLEEERTSEEEVGVDGREERDVVEEDAMGATTAMTLADLQVEKSRVEELLVLAQRVYEQGEESKFDRLWEVIQDPEFRNEKLLIFTEHRDTMDYLVQRLEGMGYTGQVARIHGGMPYPEREVQMEDFRSRCRFMVATDAAGEGINLQFCWIMANYDIPWNPARIEQRFGRIHRYKQTHEPVVLVNLVANKTREGKVLGRLLEKLELIRKNPEIGDKVFDVIGRQFQGVSLTDIIMRAVVENSPDEEADRVQGFLTDDQVRAIKQFDDKLRATGGDVSSLLPTLLEQRERDQIHRLLPGYVRSFIQKSTPKLGIAVNGDLNGRFHLERLPLALALSLEEATEGRTLPVTVNRPDPDEQVLWLRPGEPFFDHYRAYFCERIAEAALRGGAFVDPYASELYLYHLALLATVRKRDPEFPDAFRDDQVLNLRLAAVTQPLNGDPRQCQVEHLMVLRPVELVPPTAWPAHQQVDVAVTRAASFLRDVVLQPVAEERRQALLASVERREEFLRKGFDFQEADLLSIRARLREQARTGDQSAARRLEEVRRRQQDVKVQEAQALAVLRREPELVEPGEVTFLAHALVLPSTDHEERQRHDREVERIATQVAWAYEESQGAQVWDVHTPELARAAGLVDWPGFDLLTRRPDGEQRCIEVKGRRTVGDVELKENEWVKAANLQEQYWLYVVYDCAAAHPRLLRVQDPFIKLLVRAKGGVVVDESSVFEAAEEEGRH